MLLETPQIVAILGAITALIGAMVQLIREVRRTHRLVNSRMDELLALTASSSRAEGVLEHKASLELPEAPR